jgi:hypothetical protein
MTIVSQQQIEFTFRDIRNMMQLVCVAFVLPTYGPHGLLRGHGQRVVTLVYDPHLVGRRAWPVFPPQSFGTGELRANR